MRNSLHGTEPTRCFAAIDFETADRGSDSACSVAVVKVVGIEIVARWHRYIKPPRRTFSFTYIHGITWRHVENQPTFSELWPDLIEFLEGVEFLAAHNASFDRSVLQRCCQSAKIPLPSIPFQCTVKMAREIWGLRPTRLPDVCRYLNIPLEHHRAQSDAEACALIVIAALRSTRTPALARG